MRQAILLSVLLLLACASTADVRSEIQAQYDLLAKALEREDLDSVLSFRTRDFNTIGPDGRHLTYEEMVEYNRNWFARSVAVLVRSANSINCCSLIRFSMSPRPQ